jgi:hypothetical protein
MKTINFSNEPDFEVIDAAGIILICDENMNFTISDEDYERLKAEFPAAFDDCFIIHKVEDVELDKHNNQGDYLSWVIDGVPQWCQGEFFVDKDGILHHTAIAPNGDEVEITIPYFS